MFEELNQLEPREVLSIVYILNKALTYKIPPEDLQVSYPLSKENIIVVKEILKKIQEVENKSIEKFTQDEIDTFIGKLSDISRQCSQNIITFKLTNPSKIIKELHEIELYPEIKEPPVFPEVERLEKDLEQKVTELSIIKDNLQKVMSLNYKVADEVKNIMKEKEAEIEALNHKIGQLTDYIKETEEAPKAIRDIRNILIHRGFLSKKELDEIIDKIEKD